MIIYINSHTKKLEPGIRPATCTGLVNFLTRVPVMNHLEYLIPNPQFYTISELKLNFNPYATQCQNFDFNLRRDHQKKFL